MIENKKHVMVDIETLGTNARAVILSIGACRFDIETGEILGKFYRNISWDNDFWEREISPSTLQWWFNQRKAAQKAWSTKQVPLTEALVAFSAWFPKSSLIWANGPSFDITILGDAYEQYGIDAPWFYRNVQSFRTAKLFGEEFTKEKIDKTGVYHNALDDAINQAQQLSVWHRAIKNR